MTMVFQKYEQVSYGFRGFVAVTRLYSPVSFLYCTTQK